MAFQISGTEVITNDRLVNNISGASGSRPGSPVTGQLFFNTTSGELEVWNGSAWKGRGTYQGPNTPSLYTWGSNYAGALGANDLSYGNRSSPGLVAGTINDWVFVSQRGNSFGHAIRANGQLWAWGRNNYSQLGLGNYTSRSSPLQVTGGSANWVSVGQGDTVAWAVRADGTAFGWGRNGSGQTGTNTQGASNITSPTAVVGGFTDWKHITGGLNFAIGLRGNGTLWGWGNGSNLGQNSFTDRSSPVSVVGGFTDWIEVCAGRNHTTALRANGTLYSWGYNGQGRMGIGSFAGNNYNSPVLVAGGITTWNAISAGRYGGLAAKTDGTAWAWGRNDQGQVGTNNTTNYASPVAVVGGFTDVVQVAAGRYMMGVLRANGTIWTWGGEGNGVLGINAGGTRSSPTSVAGNISDWTFVTASFGRYNTAALRSTPLRGNPMNT